MGGLNNGKGNPDNHKENHQDHQKDGNRRHKRREKLPHLRQTPMSSRHIEERRRVESVTSTKRLMDAINGTVSCIQGQIAQLQSLTKLVVPNTSVCPGWGNVTITPAAATTTTPAA